uniref:Reverse transcriptase Ty1/copia-type domain-containing protein n=1 Tax=Solanum lycopersicum TaxID=4081 RepID=A0A3Q7GD21_SOLLC
MPLSSSNSGNDGYYNNNTTSSGTGRGVSNFQNNVYRNKRYGDARTSYTAGTSQLYCEFCHYKGHTKETCYKLHGYPKKKGGVSSYANNASTGNESGMIDSTSGSNARTNESSNDTTLGQGVSMFTQEQYYEILQMLRKRKSKEVDTMANVATAGVSGTSRNFTALMSDMSHINWIIDTSASNHMVHNFGLMSQSTNLDVQGGMRVNLPTGDQVKNFYSSWYMLMISWSKEGILMNQRKYALGLVSELGLAGCKPSSTPLEFNHKLTSTVFDEFIGKNANAEDLLLDDFGKYQRLIGKLLYLTMTRPDIAFIVQVLSQYMHSPKSSHMEAALRVVRYIKGTAGLGLFMSSNKDNEMVAYCDSNWGACVETRRSVTGYMIKLGGALVSWKSKK